MKNLLSLLLFLALLSGCNRQEKSASSDAPLIAYGVSAPEEISADAESSVESKASSADGAAVLPMPQARVGAGPRLLIYHAELRLKVASLRRATARVDSLVRRSGGYLSATDETRDEDEGEWRQEATIRVQPGGFQALLAGLSGLGTVETRKLSTDDVTAEHADVAARLRTKRALEQRYLALLGQARQVKDLLDIEKSLSAVREEIESTESRLKVLDDEVAYSTITLTCYQPLPRPTPDAPVLSLGSRLVEGLYDGWRQLTGLLVGLVANWPLLLLGSLAGWLLLRWRRRRRVQGR